MSNLNTQLSPEQQQQQQSQQSQQQQQNKQQQNRPQPLSRQGSNYNTKSSGNRSNPISRQGSSTLLNRQNSNKNFQYSEALQQKIKMLKENLKASLASPIDTTDTTAVPDYYALENQKMKELEYQHQLQYIEQLKRQEEMEFKRQLQYQQKIKAGSPKTQNILIIPEEGVEGDDSQQQQEGQEQQQEEEEEKVEVVEEARPKTPEMVLSSQRWTKALKPVDFAKKIDVSLDSDVKAPITIPADRPTMEFTFTSEVAEKRKSDLRKKIYVGSKHNVRLIAPPGIVGYRSSSPNSTRSSIFSTSSEDSGSFGDLPPEHNLTRTSVKTLYNRPASSELTEEDTNTYTVNIIPSTQDVPIEKKQRERSTSPPLQQQQQQVRPSSSHGPSPLRPKTADSQISQFSNLSKVTITRDYENVTPLPDNIIPISDDKVYYDSKGANNKNLSLGKSQIPVLASLISGNKNNNSSSRSLLKPKENKVENLNKLYEEELSGEAYKRKSKLYNRISNIDTSILPQDNEKVNEVDSKTLDVIQKRNNKNENKEEEEEKEVIKVNTENVKLDPININTIVSPIKNLKNVKSKLMEPTVSSLASSHPKIVKEEKKYEMKPIRPLSPLLPNTFLVMDGVLTSKLPPSEISMCVVPPKNSKQMQQIEQYTKQQQHNYYNYKLHHNNNSDEDDDDFDDFENSNNQIEENNFIKTKTTITSPNSPSSPSSTLNKTTSNNNNNNNSYNNTVKEEKSEGSLMSVRPCTTIPQLRKSELVTPIRKTMSSQGKRTSKPNKQQEKKKIDYYKYYNNNNNIYLQNKDDPFELPPLKTSQYELSKSINSILPTFSQKPSELSFKPVGEFEYPIQKFSRSTPLFVDDVI